MDPDLEKFIDSLLSLVVWGVVLSVVAVVEAGLWFCFDDHLAALLDNQMVGHLPFWSVWAFAMLPNFALTWKEALDEAFRKAGPFGD